MPFPLHPSFVAAAETSLQVRFPEHFVQRMLASNGGELLGEDDDWQLFPFRDDSDRKRLARTMAHIAKETASARTWPGFPQDGVAIASNGAGDLLLLLPSPEDGATLGETVFCWRHEDATLEPIAGGISELEPEDD